MINIAVSSFQTYKRRRDFRALTCGRQKQFNSNFNYPACRESVLQNSPFKCPLIRVPLTTLSFFEEHFNVPSQVFSFENVNAQIQQLENVFEVKCWLLFNSTEFFASLVFHKFLFTAKVEAVTKLHEWIIYLKRHLRSNNLVDTKSV